MTRDEQNRELVNKVKLEQDERYYTREELDKLRELGIECYEIIWNLKVPLPEPEPPKFYNLICTECNHILMNNISHDAMKLVQAGYCNRGNCNGKLEWKES